MNKLVILALIALFAVSAALVPKGFGGRRGVPRWAFDEEEEADNKVWDWIKQRSNQDKLRNWTEKAVKTYDIWRNDEEEEESDFINWKKIGSIAKDIGKNYLSTKYGINLDEAEEESDFIKINWSKIGNIAKDIGKSYLSSKYGINLDEAEEESDSEFINWKKVWGTAKDIGKSYLSSKYGINLDEESEQSDFINLKKIWGVAKDIGKNYLSTKYGINLDEEEEESDFINWKKVWGTAKDIGKSYLSSKYGINLDEEEESDQNRAFDFGANVNGRNWNVNAGLTGQTRNGGSYNVGGNFGNGGQWGVNGGYDRTWNNGRTSFGGNAGYGSGGFNAGVKFTHRFDDVEESDFINWKKVWGVAKDIGKNYLSTKYGVNLDEEEEADFNWLLAAKVAAKVFKPRPAY